MRMMPILSQETIERGQRLEPLRKAIDALALTPCQPPQPSQKLDPGKERMGNLWAALHELHQRETEQFAKETDAFNVCLRKWADEIIHENDIAHPTVPLTAGSVRADVNTPSVIAALGGPSRVDTDGET